MGGSIQREREREREREKDKERQRQRQRDRERELERESSHMTWRGFSPRKIGGPEQQNSARCRSKSGSGPALPALPAAAAATRPMTMLISHGGVKKVFGQIRLGPAYPAKLYHHGGRGNHHWQSMYHSGWRLDSESESLAWIRPQARGQGSAAARRALLARMGSVLHDLDHESCGDDSQPQ